MKLIDKLKASINALNKANVKVEPGASAVAVRIEAVQFEKFCNDTRGKLVKQIEEEVIPRVVVEDRSFVTWIGAQGNGGSGRHNDVWKEFIQFFESEGLKIVVNDITGRNQPRLEITVVLA